MKTTLQYRPTSSAAVAAAISTPGVSSGGPSENDQPISTYKHPEPRHRADYPREYAVLTQQQRKALEARTLLAFEEESFSLASKIRADALRRAANSRLHSPPSSPAVTAPTGASTSTATAAQPAAMTEVTAASRGSKMTDAKTSATIQSSTGHADEAIDRAQSTTNTDGGYEGESVYEGDDGASIAISRGASYERGRGFTGKSISARSQPATAVNMRANAAQAALARAAAGRTATAQAAWTQPALAQPAVPQALLLLESPPHVPAPQSPRNDVDDGRGLSCNGRVRAGVYVPTRRADGSFDWVRRKSDPPPPARPLVRELLLDGRVARTTMLEGTTMLEEAIASAAGARCAAAVVEEVLGSLRAEEASSRQKSEYPASQLKWSTSQLRCEAAEAATRAVANAAAVAASAGIPACTTTPAPTCSVWDSPQPWTELHQSSPLLRMERGGSAADSKRWKKVHAQTALVRIAPQELPLWPSPLAEPSARVMEWFINLPRILELTLQQLPRPPTAAVAVKEPTTRQAFQSPFNGRQFRQSPPDGRQFRRRMESVADDLQAAEVGPLHEKDDETEEVDAKNGLTTAELMLRGHQSNERGEYAAARVHFQCAYERSHSVAAQLSAANMALKAHEPRLAAYEYEQVLLRADLPEVLRAQAAEKLIQSEAAVENELPATAPWDSRMTWQERLLAPADAVLKTYAPPRRSTVAAAYLPDDAPSSRFGWSAIRTPVQLTSMREPSQPPHALEQWQRSSLPPTTGSAAEHGRQIVSYPYRGVRLPAHLSAWQAHALAHAANV